MTIARQDDDSPSDQGPTAERARAEEKITINLPPTDVGIIDLLAQAGHGRNRSSVIRRAIAFEIRHQQRVIDTTLQRYRLMVASEYFDEERVRDIIESGEPLSMNIVGRFEISDDVPDFWASKVFDRVRVVGVVRGPKDVLGAINIRRGLPR